MLSCGNGIAEVNTVKKPRPYQQECIDICDSKESGSYMVCIPTGGGKTFIFSRMKRRGKVLAVAHRRELIDQMADAFREVGCSVEIEQAERKATGEADVICASIQTLNSRIDKFPRDFPAQIIFDEAHRSTAKTYQKVIDYFHPQVQFFFTATPNRLDGAGYKKFIDEIIFHRDIRYMIDNDYLCDIECKLILFGYNLDDVTIQSGDYKLNELDKKLIGTEKLVADVYYEYARGSTVIFAATVRHATEIANHIDGAYVVSGKTPKEERKDILDRYSNGEIKCLVNVMVLTEGWDAPITETIIHARPTQSQIFYIQASGRGMRLHPGKESMLLIDCVGITKHSICCAPTLLGLDISCMPDISKKIIEGNLFDISKKLEAEIKLDGFISKVETIELWAKKEKLCLYDINFQKSTDGTLFVEWEEDGNNIRYEIPPIDILGHVRIGEISFKAQKAIDDLWCFLHKEHSSSGHHWNNSATDCIDVWSKKQGIKTHGMTFEKSSDGTLTLEFDDVKFTVPLADSLGNVNIDGKHIPIQQHINNIHHELCKTHYDKSDLWDIKTKAMYDEIICDTKRKILRYYYPDVVDSDMSNMDLREYMKLIKNRPEKKVSDIKK
jgi:hypothetical protein